MCITIVFDSLYKLSLSELPQVLDRYIKDVLYFNSGPPLIQPNKKEVLTPCSEWFLSYAYILGEHIIENTATINNIVLIINFTSSINYQELNLGGNYSIRPNVAHVPGSPDSTQTQPIGWPTAGS